MNFKFYLLIALCLCAQSQIIAQNVPEESLDEVVVTDSRFELKRENSGKTVIKISQQEIENNQGRTISELINTKSGIEINGSRSNAGQNLGVYVRGGRNRQVLVLIDGVQVSDPSETSGEYDFRLLNLNQVESIEIIKGAASTLYGSGAAAAVVNIKTKKAAAKKINAIFTSTIGTNHSEADQNYNIANFNNSVAVSGTLEKFTYRSAFSHQFADGLSAAITDENERDPYSKYGVDVNLGYSFNTSLSLNVYGNFTDINSNYDSSAFFDADNVFKSQQSRVGISSKYKYTNGSININAAFSEFDREFISIYPSVFDSKNYVLDIYNKYTIDQTFYTIIGLNVIENTVLFTDKETFTIVDPYINFVYVSDFGLNINAGGRLNNHSVYGSHFTYNMNPSFTFKSSEQQYTKLFASYSTSFITPSLSQLYGFYSPNPDLDPEENRTIEGGVEFKFNNNFRVSALYFNREEQNVITYGFPLYLNVADKVNTNGVELELSSNVTDDLSFNANYTFVENKDVVVVRVPKHKVNAQLAYDISKRTFASLNYQYIHDRIVNDFSTFPSSKLDLNAFSLINFYISHSTTANKVVFFAGIDNVLNEDYNELLGFVSKGRNVRLGFKLNL